MKFKIPFTFSSIEVLKKKSKSFARFFRRKERAKLAEHLENSDVALSSSEYLGICLRTFIFAFIILLLISSFTFYFLRANYFYALALALVFSCYVFFRQANYPKIFSFRKTRDIENNLIAALQDMLVQLQSGVPMFQIMTNIANSDYGSLSKEFRKAVNEINSGVPQIDALENLIKKNQSTYFKRVLWQISNGLKSGSDMTMVIKDSIDSLNKEQAIQIQNYGNKLNPIIMFYMLIAVILPALGITFLTILSSMLGLSGKLVKLLFVGVFVIVVLVQLMFLGMIKTRRPSLL